MLRYYPKRTGSAFTSANTETWNYNAKGEVVTANSTNNVFDRSFEFDGIGNRKKSADSITLPTADNYIANTLNQLTSVNGGARIHDADGNLTDDGEKLFIWDAENRLIEIKLKSDDSTVATYAYDYQSRRITKTVGATETNFVYDGWNPIAEYTSALSPLSFTLSTSYTWGMDLSGSMQGAGGVGGLLSVNDGSATYYPIYDGNGNVSEYVDATGAVVAHYEYDGFGQVVASGSKKDDFTHQFSTKQLDSESGLHYYGYRYYDSSNGRWPSRDPIEEDGGVNLYAFVGNDPIINWDHLGLYTLQDALYTLGGCSSIGSGRARHRCVQLARRKYSSQNIYDEWYRLEKTRGSWWTGLPKCPKKLCVGTRERGGRNPSVSFAINIYAEDPSQWHKPGRPSNAELNLHPGTIWSMRSKADGAGHANQCTYDAKGILLRTPPGSGTVDWYRSGTQTHYNHDVAPVYLANSLDGGASMGVISNTFTGGPSILGTPGANLNKYFEVRPLWAESP